jgi:hypothetical protein
MPRTHPLTETDHDNLDALLTGVFEDVSAGTVPRADAVSGLAHVFAALDQRNYGEVRSWLEQGRNFIRNLPAPG